MESFSAVAFLGAMAIFMYGIRQSRIGIQLLAGDRLRSLVASFTDNRFVALVTGILTTLILQSSTATTVMLVGFAATGAITLTQAMGVILGADIGTTLVVALLSVKKIADYALLMLVAGVFLDIASQKKKTRHFSMVLLGFGFVFFGMQLMIHTTSPLKGNPLLTQIFLVLGDNPAYAFFLGAIFTGLVQNSATTLGLTIALAFSGLLNLTEAIPIVIGANVGTCTGSFVNSIGGGPCAKRVAIAHLFFKLTGAVVVMFLLKPYASLITILSSYFPGLQMNVASQIALTHLIFNLALSCLFLPFISQGAWMIDKIFPEPLIDENKIFGPRYLDPKSLETPALAFANAKRELLRMAEIAYTMFRNIIVVFEKQNHLIEEIEEQDDKVDILDREIKLYLAKISQESLTPEQARMQLNLVAITTDLEEVCDITSKSILELAERMYHKGRHFSEEGWNELKDVHAKVQENFELMISLLTHEDEAMARKATRHEKQLAVIEDQYREAHLQRLHKGLKESIETSSIHLEILSHFRRINSKLTAMVKAIIPEKSLYQTP